MREGCRIMSKFPAGWKCHLPPPLAPEECLTLGIALIFADGIRLLARAHSQGIFSSTHDWPGSVYAPCRQ